MREELLPQVGFVLPVIRSEIFPSRFRHGFTTRRGGVSAPPFDSLNLGGKWGDAPAQVRENQRRLGLAAGGRSIYFATQVHGRDSVVVAAGQSAESVASVRADAVIAATPGTAVGIYVADCVPVLIADVRSGACAAVHAGWRGTVAGVVAATLWRLMTETGARAEDLRIAMGPSIGPCCFEVGPEVVTAVEAAFPGARAAGAIHDEPESETATEGHHRRPHVDLWVLNRLSAQSVGIPAAAIDVGAMCTSCDRERFYSYRRDRGVTGQLAAFIVCDQDPRSTTP